MFPIYVKEPGFREPEDPIYYVVTKSGLFQVKRTPVFRSRVRVRGLLWLLGGGSTKAGFPLNRWPEVTAGMRSDRIPPAVSGSEPFTATARLKPSIQSSMISTNNMTMGSM